MSFDSIFQQIGKATNVSIPFKQGDVFRQVQMVKLFILLMRLNPFRAGRCLSTLDEKVQKAKTLSQSLSSRAMSFD